MIFNANNPVPGDPQALERWAVQYARMSSTLQDMLTQLDGAVVNLLGPGPGAWQGDGSDAFGQWWAAVKSDINVMIGAFQSIAVILLQLAFDIQTAKDIYVRAEQEAFNNCMNLDNGTLNNAEVDPNATARISDLVRQAYEYVLAAWSTAVNGFNQTGQDLASKITGIYNNTSEQYHYQYWQLLFKKNPGLPLNLPQPFGPEFHRPNPEQAFGMLFLGWAPGCTPDRCQGPDTTVEVPHEEHGAEDPWIEQIEVP